MLIVLALSTFDQGSILQVAYLRTQTWQGSTKCYYRCNFRDVNKYSNLKAKDWRFKAKARTKDSNFALKDNQGPRTKAKDNIPRSDTCIRIYAWLV